MGWQAGTLHDRERERITCRLQAINSNFLMGKTWLEAKDVLWAKDETLCLAGRQPQQAYLRLFTIEKLIMQDCRHISRIKQGYKVESEICCCELHGHFDDLNL